MDRAASLLILTPIAYIIGSIPFGLLVGFSRGIDVRKSGSGNIGATNVGRLLGGKFFALVFTLDLLKGLVPMLIAGALLRGIAIDAHMYALWLLVGFSAICGHLFSVFLKFKGGKGVATSAGVMLGIFPYFTLPGLVAVGCFIALFKLTRYVSVASMGGAVLFPIAYVIMGIALKWDVFGKQWPLLAFSLLIAIMIVVKHRGNIARLRAGTENKFTKRKPAISETT